MMNQIYQMSLGRLFSGAKGMHRVVTAWMMLPLVSLSALAQDVTVSGKVVGSDGDGIPGVTVQVKGAQKGTQTDLDGKFQLAGVPSKATLVFSFVGMTAQEYRDWETILLS